MRFYHWFLLCCISVMIILIIGCKGKGGGPDPITPSGMTANANNASGVWEANFEFADSTEYLYNGEEPIMAVYPRELLSDTGDSPKFILPGTSEFKFRCQSNLDLSMAYAVIDTSEIPVSVSGDTISINITGIDPGTHSLTILAPDENSKLIQKSLLFYNDVQVGDIQFGFGDNGLIMVKFSKVLPESIIENLNDWTLTGTPRGDLKPVNAEWNSSLKSIILYFDYDIKSELDQLWKDGYNVQLNYDSGGIVISEPFNDIPYVSGNADNSISRTAETNDYCQRGFWYPPGQNGPPVDWNIEKKWGIYWWQDTITPMNGCEYRRLANWEEERDANGNTIDNPGTKDWCNCAPWIKEKWWYYAAIKSDATLFPALDHDPYSHSSNGSYHELDIQFGGTYYNQNFDRGTGFDNPAFALSVNCDWCGGEPGRVMKGYYTMDDVPGDCAPPKFVELLLINPNQLDDYYNDSSGNSMRSGINNNAAHDGEICRVWNQANQKGLGYLDAQFISFYNSTLPTTQAYLAVHAEDDDPSGRMGKYFNVLNNSRLCLDFYQSGNLVHHDDNVAAFCRIDYKPHSDYETDPGWPTGAWYNPNNTVDYLVDGVAGGERTYWLIPLTAADMNNFDSLRVRIEDQWNWRRSGDLLNPNNYSQSHVGSSPYDYYFPEGPGQPPEFKVEAVKIIQNIDNHCGNVVRRDFGDTKYTQNNPDLTTTGIVSRAINNGQVTADIFAMSNYVEDPPQYIPVRVSTSDSFQDEIILYLYPIRIISGGRYGYLNIDGNGSVAADASDPSGTFAVGETNNDVFLKTMYLDTGINWVDKQNSGDYIIWGRYEIFYPSLQQAAYAPTLLIVDSEESVSSDLYLNRDFNSSTSPRLYISSSDWFRGNENRAYKGTGDNPITHDQLALQSQSEDLNVFYSDYDCFGTKNGIGNVFGTSSTDPDTLDWFNDTTLLLSDDVIYPAGTSAPSIQGGGIQKLIVKYISEEGDIIATCPIQSESDIAIFDGYIGGTGGIGQFIESRDGYHGTEAGIQPEDFSDKYWRDLEWLVLPGDYLGDSALTNWFNQAITGNLDYPSQHKRYRLRSVMGFYDYVSAGLVHSLDKKSYMNHFGETLEGLISGNPADTSIHWYDNSTRITDPDASFFYSKDLACLSWMQGMTQNYLNDELRALAWGENKFTAVQAINSTTKLKWYSRYQRDYYDCMPYFCPWPDRFGAPNLNLDVIAEHN
jgi:hypothetical protein